MSETLVRVSATITPSDLPEPLRADGPYRVAMVCTGNICRSAMAEVVLVDRLAGDGVPDRGPDGVAVTSSGVSDEELGNPIDRRALRTLAAAGYGEGDDAATTAAARAIATHRAHRISDEELRGSDLLLAMTSNHLRELARRAERLGVDPDRIRMFRSYDPAALAERQVIADGSRARYSLDVPDPWYGTQADFEDTLEVVERVVGALEPALAELARTRR